MVLEGRTFFTPVKYNKIASSEAALEKDLCSALSFVFLCFSLTSVGCSVFSRVFQQNELPRYSPLRPPIVVVIRVNKIIQISFKNIFYSI